MTCQETKLGPLASGKVTDFGTHINHLKSFPIKIKHPILYVTIGTSSSAGCTLINGKQMDPKSAPASD